MKLTPNQQRQIKRLAPHVDRVTAADRSFFQKHFDRKHLVRHTSEAEIAEIEITSGWLMQAPKGRRWFTIVRKVPGGRLRVFIVGRDGAETGLDVPEDVADVIFDTVAPTEVRKAEAALRAAAKADGSR
jgi:hypothetical protein